MAVIGSALSIGNSLRQEHFEGAGSRLAFFERNGGGFFHDEGVFRVEIEGAENAVAPGCELVEGVAAFRVGTDGPKLEALLGYVGI